MHHVVGVIASYSSQTHTLHALQMQLIISEAAGQKQQENRNDSFDMIVHVLQGAYTWILYILI